MTLARALADGLEALELDVGDAAQARLLAYVALLTKWNRTYNLTAIREPERMVTHHLLDSLAVLPHLPRARRLRVVDIGSGAGLPGIPIALARPSWRVALIDSNGKKVAFLRQAAAELGLHNVEVIAMRAANYRPAEAFDLAVSRAYADLETFAGDAVRLTGRSGRWLAMKGAYPEDEIRRLADTIRVVAVPRLEIPGVDAERHLVVMEQAP